MADGFVISEEKARSWCLEILEKAGLTGEKANYVSDCLIQANLRGVDTHGLIRLIPYVGRLKNTKTQEVCILEDRETTCVVDAGFQLGPIGASIGMEKAIQKAQKYGVGMAVVRNSNHCGTAAYYALKAVESGMVGVSMTNASRRIAPWGSTEAIIGNNPWTGFSNRFGYGKYRGGKRKNTNLPAGRAKAARWVGYGQRRKSNQRSPCGAGGPFDARGRIQRGRDCRYGGSFMLGT